MEKANNNTDFKGLFKDPKTKNFTLWVVGLTVLMIIVFLGINQLLCIKDFGQLGDFFNGIAAPVLALITIVLLYNSFLVQKEELKAATKAIEQSTEEMKRSAEIMERTEQNAKLERLESICLKLLDSYKHSIQEFEKTQSLEAINRKILFNGEDGADLFFIRYANFGTDLDNELSNYKDRFENGKDNFMNIKKLVYSFISIYRCIINSNIEKKQVEHLTFAINTQISEIEFFFIKFFINQLEDLSDLRTPLEDYSINSSSTSIYEMHIKPLLKL